jgi:eukaryotic-like serine/threonine-protein kinase
VDLRRKLGESLPSLERFNKPLSQATTSSFEAWKQFSLGDEVYRKGDFRAASGYFERATQLDRGFALAYLRLAFSYMNSLRPREVSMNALKRAMELKDKVSERESLELCAREPYHRGDYDKAVELGRQWIQWYPRDPDAYHFLGVVLGTVGQYEEAVEAERQAVQLGAGSAAIGNLALDLRLVGKSEEAEATLRQGLARGYESDTTHWSLCRLAAVRGDQAEMQRQVEWLKRSSNGRSRINAYLEQQGLAVVSGRLKAADQLVQQTLEVFKQDKFFGLNTTLVDSKIRTSRSKTSYLYL